MNTSPDGRYHPTMDEALRWVDLHDEAIMAFGRSKVTDLLAKAVANPLGFCHSAMASAEVSTGKRSRSLLILCLVATHAPNKAIVAEYQEKSPASSTDAAGLAGLDYMDLLNPAFKTRNLIVLKVDTPSAVVLCAADPVTVEYLEHRFGVYLDAIDTGRQVIGEWRPHSSSPGAS